MVILIRVLVVRPLHFGFGGFFPLSILDRFLYL